MRFIDLTHGFYAGMPYYPADWYPKFAIHSVMTPDTDPYESRRTFTRLEVFAHNATHVDAPRHFFEDRETLDELSLDIFMGKAFVVNLSHKHLLEPITGDDLEKGIGDIWQPGSRLLIRTDYLRHHWGRPDFWEKPPYLTVSAADWIVQHQAVLVGLDCLTEYPGDVFSPVHKQLLGAGVPILEYITNMHSVGSRVGLLIALPMKVAGVEAAPVRALFFPDWPEVE